MQYNYFNNNMQYNPDKLPRNRSDDNRNEMINSAKQVGLGGLRKINGFIFGRGKRRGAVGKSINGIRNAGKVVRAFGKFMGFLLKTPWGQAILCLAVIIGILLLFLIGNAQYKGKNLDYGNNGTLGKGNTETNSTVKYTGNAYDAQVMRFFQYSSNLSYYQLLPNGKLIKADDKDAVQDFYKREENYKLSPAFLTSLNNSLIKNQFYFPEQFIQPIYHKIVDEIINGKKTGRKTAQLLDLVDEDGSVIAKSKVNQFAENEQGELVKTSSKTIDSVANHGFASIMRYMDAKRVLYLQGTYRDDVWHGSAWDKTTANVKLSQPVEYGPSGFKNPAKNYEKWYPGQPQNIDDYYGSDETYSSKTGDIDSESKSRSDIETIDYVISADENIHLLDDVLTFTGKYTFTYEAIPEIYSELPESAREKEIGTFVYNMQEKEREVWKTVTDTATNTQSRVKVKEKYYTADTGKLYRHYSGSMYEIMPRVDKTYFNGEDANEYILRMSKEDKTEEEQAEYDAEIERKFKYAKDYAFNFEAFVPMNVLEKLDYDERTGGAYYVLDNSAIGKEAIPADVLALEPIFEKYSNGNEVLKNLLMAKCARESGGVNISGENNNAWGIMQIENTQGRKNFMPYSRGSGLLFGTEVRITLDPQTDERLDKEKSIKWASEHFTYLAQQYDGDLLKAMQAYNFGVGAMNWLLEEAEATGQNWMELTPNILEIVRKHGLDWSGDSYGDPSYVANVLQFYKGDTNELLNGMDIGFFTGIWSKITDMIRNYDMENEPLMHFKPAVSISDYNFEHMMRDATALDEDETIDDVNWEMYDFYDSQVMDGASSGKSIQSYEDLQTLVPTIGSFSTPLRVANPPMTSGFGERIHPISKKRKMHNGIDIAVPEGTPIYSIGEGVFNKGFEVGKAGNWVTITHADGIKSTYCHMQGFNPELVVGETYPAGTWIGNVGNTGGSTGAHLHFAIRKNNVYIDPYFFAYPPDNLGENL